MNKILQVLGTILWYAIVGIVCFLAGWLIRAIKAKKATTKATKA